MYKLKTLSVFVAAIAFAGCEAGVQDGGGSDSRSSMNGLAVDGRVANGKVWADRDGDGALDDFEPFAWTDQYGYYTYRPAKEGEYTAKDYCATDATLDEQKHCLRYGASSDDVMIRIRGGIDLDTGEKLKGVMAMESSVSESSSAANRATPKVLSPLTTMLASVPEAQKASLKAALGITAENEAALLKKDYSAAGDAESRGLYAKALAVQTILDVAFSAGGSDSTAQLSTLTKLAEKIAASGDVSSLDETAMSEVLASAGVSAEKRAKTAKRMNSINTVIATVATASSAEDVKKQIKAVEVVSQLVKKEADGETIAALGDEDSDTISTVVTAVQGAIGDGEDIDIRSVSDSIKNVDAANDAAGLTGAVNDNKLAGEIDWAGGMFILRPDSELRGDVAAKDYVLVYLEEGGELNMCASVIPTDPLGDEAPNTDKEFFGGSWSKISDSSISLIIEWEGQEFNGQVKALAGTESLYAGETDADVATAMNKYRLTSDLAEDESAILLRDVGDAYDFYTVSDAIATVFNIDQDTATSDQLNVQCVNVDGDIRARLGAYIAQ